MTNSNDNAAAGRHNPHHNKGVRSISPAPGGKHHHHRHHHHHHHHNKIRSLSPFPAGGHGTAGRRDSGGNKDILVCHASAHAIVFRDHLRMARKIIQEEEGEEHESIGSSESGEEQEQEGEEYEGGSEAFKELQSVQGRIRGSISNASEIVKEINHLAHDLVPELESVRLDFKNLKDGVSERNIQIEGLNAPITPLPALEWNMKTNFEELFDSSTVPTEDWSPAEIEVYDLLDKQKACVKTIQKNEWPSFLQRFLTPVPNQSGRGRGQQHYDIASSDENHMTFNSFVTSTSLLPAGGKKMRCYGSELSYPIGVVFGIPQFDSPEAENDAVNSTQTWAWPAGYAAKTEFNIDNRGQLINGRQEALVSLSQIRQYNHEYLHSQDHYIAGKIIKGGFKTVPYNECFVRVGGPGRLVNGIDVTATADTDTTAPHQQRSLDKGCGLFMALFIRTTAMGDIIDLMRTKARIQKTLGKQYVQDIPLLYLHHDHGIRVFTKKMQQSFWEQASTRLQPFPNPTWGMKVSIRDTSERSLQHKLIEQLDYTTPSDPLNNLTHHQLAKIAGGFGFTDTSFLTLLMSQPDFKHVHDVMQQVFAASIRSNDYYTARQSLVLYALANTSTTGTCGNDEMDTADVVSQTLQKLDGSPAATYTNLSVLKPKPSKQRKGNENVVGEEISNFPSPVATKRWRRATHNEGLLVVLGAAQILKTITVDSAQRRTEEAIIAVEEWVHHGEESIAFRVSSWKDQKVDQKDGNIAMKNDTAFMAFVTGKSVKNRRDFAQQLREAVPKGNFTSIGFLQGTYNVVCRMHSPCMRLELLQYILALDNRYSVELIRDSIELAATCLGAIAKEE